MALPTQPEELLQLIVEHVPQGLLCILVLYIFTLFAKDILGGFKRPFLHPEKWQALPLVDKKELTHNTCRFRFALPHADQKLGLPIGQHITLKVADGSEVMRPYTPSSDIDQRGFVDFVIKIYPDGQMTPRLDKLAIGDTVLFKGPKGRFTYTPNSKRAIGMLAGGTGIAPMYQVLQSILKNPNDKTQLSLIFGNLTADDILLKPELDALAEQYPDHFKVYYVINTAPKGWAGGVGFITQDMIKKHLPAPAEDVLILRCGPSPMNKAMEVHLEALGYKTPCTFQF